MKVFNKYIAAPAIALLSAFLAAQTSAGAMILPPVPKSDRQTTMPVTPPAITMQSAVREAWQRALMVDDNARPACLAPHMEQAAAERPLIVIDLGHRYQAAPGLIDHGTSNYRAGLTEVNIIDAVGGQLRETLEARGYEVVLTREPGEALRVAHGDYRASLSSRGFMPGYLSQELSRPVLLVSLHVDSVRSGPEVYVQNSIEGVAEDDSWMMADTLASHMEIGGRSARVNPGGDRFRGDGRFNNRMLRSFEREKRSCAGVRGAAALIELGNLNDPYDIASFHAILRNPGPVAARIAGGIDSFAQAHYPAMPVTPQRALTPVQL